MGGGWYEIQQFVDNITCKNFNMVMSVKTTINKHTCLMVKTSDLKRKADVREETQMWH